MLFDISSDEHSVALKIEADGAWTANVKPVSSARKWTASGKLSGKGDDVVRVDPPASGLTAATIKHQGKSNFAVTSYSPEGGDLLVNEIGAFSGEELLPNGTFLLQIEADGAWTVVV